MKVMNDLPPPLMAIPPTTEAEYYASEEEEDANLLKTGAFPDDEIPDPSEKIRVRFKK